MVRKSHQCLHQVVHRIYEGRVAGTTINENQVAVCGNPVKTENGKVFYAKLSYKNWTISCKPGNNCVFLHDNRILYIEYIFMRSNEIFISGLEVSILKPSFQ